MKPFFRITATAPDSVGIYRDCLVVIAEHDSIVGIDGYYGSEANHGQLYPNLDELVSAGYVEKGQIDDRTNAYSLTDEGRELLENRLEWEDQYVDL